MAPMVLGVMTPTKTMLTLLVPALIVMEPIQTTVRAVSFTITPVLVLGEDQAGLMSNVIAGGMVMAVSPEPPFTARPPRLLSPAPLLKPENGLALIVPLSQ